MHTTRRTAQVCQPSVQPVAGDQRCQSKHDKDEEDLGCVVNFFWGDSLHVDECAGVKAAKAKTMEQLHPHMHVHRKPFDAKDEVSKSVAENSEGHYGPEA